MAFIWNSKHHKVMESQQNILNKYVENGFKMLG